jgi:hypothetical protein
MQIFIFVIQIIITYLRIRFICIYICQKTLRKLLAIIMLKHFCYQLVQQKQRCFKSNKTVSTDSANSFSAKTVSAKAFMVKGVETKILKCYLHVIYEFYIK